MKRAEMTRLVAIGSRCKRGHLLTTKTIRLMNGIPRGCKLCRSMADTERRKLRART